MGILTCVPTSFYIPRYQGTVSSLGGFLWKENSSQNIRYAFGFAYANVISQEQNGVFLPRVRVLNLSNGVLATLEPGPIEKNGYVWFGEDSAYKVYRSMSFGWVITTGIYPGREPVEVLDYDTMEWKGTSFWTGIFPSPTHGASTEFQPRGSAKGNGSAPNLKLQFWFPHWEKTGGVAGVYTPVGESGNITLGLPVWIDAAGTEYAQSLNPVNGNYTYGGIRYADGKWVIGTVGSPSGWWEGSEPSINSSTVFIFTVPEDSEAAGSNKMITFSGYVIGDNTKEGHIGDWAICRP